MFLLVRLICLSLCFDFLLATKEIIVENPFFLRARIYDAHTATVLFEISRGSRQRTCKNYRFTVRRNSAALYSMPEQNLTFWRNSLEMKHLDYGKYRVCAIICSENFGIYALVPQLMRNSSSPVMACVNFRVPRSHFLILTLYVLVFMFLAISQITYSLRKREFHQRIKYTIHEIENSVHRWRLSQTSNDATTTEVENAVSQESIEQHAPVTDTTKIKEKRPSTKTKATFHIDITHDDALEH